MAGLRRISWFPRQSEWNYAQSWRDKHRALAQSFLDDGSSVSGALSAAWQNFTSGSAMLAAQAATKRIQAETKAKFDELSKIDISV